MFERSNIDLRVHTPVVLTIVRDLRPSTPDHLSAGRDEAQFAHVDFDDGSLGQYAELGIQWILGVFFDADDGKLDGDGEFGVSDVGALVAKTHGADEALVFNRAAGEVGADCWWKESVCLLAGSSRGMGLCLVRRADNNEDGTAEVACQKSRKAQVPHDRRLHRLTKGWFGNHPLP